MSRLVHLYINKIEYSIAIYYYKQKITAAAAKQQASLKFYLVIHLRACAQTNIKHNWTLPFTLCGVCAPHKLSPSDFSFLRLLSRKREGG